MCLDGNLCFFVPNWKNFRKKNTTKITGLILGLKTAENLSLTFLTHPNGTPMSNLSLEIFVKPRIKLIWLTFSPGQLFWGCKYQYIEMANNKLQIEMCVFFVQTGIINTIICDISCFRKKGICGFQPENNCVAQWIWMKLPYWVF